eukprot:g5870.t1
MNSKRDTARSRVTRKRQVSRRVATKRPLSPNSGQNVGGVNKKPVLRDKATDENIDHEDHPTPKVDVEFAKWLELQGLTIEDLLSKTVKLGKPPATKQHQLKFTELATVIVEFRSAAKHLLEEKNRLSTDLEQLELEKTQLEKTIDAEKTQFDTQIASLRQEIEVLEEKYKETQVYVEKLQSYNSHLVNESKQTRSELQLSEVEKRSVLEELVVIKGQNAILTEKMNEKEETAKSAIEMLGSKVQSLEKGKEADEDRIQDLKNEVLKTNKALDETKQELEKWKAEADMYQQKTGKTAEEMEKMEYKKAALESEFESQSCVLSELRKELMILKSQKQRCEEQLTKTSTKITELQVQVENKDKELKELENKLQDAETDRRKLHNTIQELKGNIRVFCRVRPPNSEEEDLHEPGTSNPILTFPKQGDENYGTSLSCLCPPAPQQPYQKLSFTFDHVFPPESTQELVFDEISQLVQSALDGYKVCIFAYGQTGSGKTYTMLGDKEHKGMIPRSMDQVFSSCQKLEERGWKFAMHASMLEIYNEEYQDLLGAGNLPSGKKHVVTHDSNGNTNVSDLLMVNVREPGSIDELLSKALSKRSTGATLLNDHSSRSHFVFTLKIEGRNFDTEQKVQGVLNLIDLAGSERVKESGAQGTRLKEAQNINRSLSALGDVIMALSNKTEHIPYRNSKLTWLLQPCLGKDAKTLMFVNISPGQSHCHESVCSLRFASKVNACEIGVARRTMVQSTAKN